MSCVKVQLADMLYWRIFFKKMGGTLSGPPEDLAFNLRKTNATLVVLL